MFERNCQFVFDGPVSEFEHVEQELTVSFVGPVAEIEHV